MERVALVIGQGDSLCEAIWTQLFDLQCRVVFMTHLESQPQNERLERMITDYRDIRIVGCDIENDDDVCRKISSIEREEGQIDKLILAFNQGIPQSLFSAAKKISEGMATHGYGRIVAIDFSELEEDREKKSPKQIEQASSVREFVQTLATEIANSKVAFNTITAGQIGHAAIRSEEETRKTGIEAQPSTEYLNQQQEIAGLAAYLVSDEATFISGANIAVNNGRYLN